MMKIIIPILILSIVGIFGAFYFYGFGVSNGEVQLKIVEKNFSSGYLRSEAVMESRYKTTKTIKINETFTLPLTENELVAYPIKLISINSNLLELEVVGLGLVTDNKVDLNIGVTPQIIKIELGNGKLIGTPTENIGSTWELVWVK